jgi:hypothetical protein
LLSLIPLHAITATKAVMFGDKETSWSNRGDRNNRDPSPCVRIKKSTISLALDAETLHKLKNMAEGEGLSINSKINSVLWKYIAFNKYVEEDGSLIIPSRTVNFFIENIDEEKWIQEYTDTLDEIVPFFFLELKTIPTLENTLKVVFDRLLLYGGSYNGCSCHVDNNGNLNLVFRHEYNIKWSRILSAAYARFIEKTLGHTAYPLNISEKWFAIKISSEATSH